MLQVFATSSHHVTRLAPVHLHVFLVSTFWHRLHLISQHQWNLHLHLCIVSTRSERYPRPQQRLSPWQLSEPYESVLQIRPTVPGNSCLELLTQKLGESFKKTKALVLGCCLVLLNLPLSRRYPPFFLFFRTWRTFFSSELSLVFAAFSILTRRALSYFWCSTSPITRKSAICLEHVLMLHDPDSPWHLHKILASFVTTWDRSKEQYYSYEDNAECEADKWVFTTGQVAATDWRPHQ